MVATFDLETDVIGVSAARTKYVLLNYQDIRGCIASKEKFCKIDGPIYPMNMRKFCVIDLFNRVKNSKICRVKIRPNSVLPYAKHIKEGLWAIASEKKTPFRVNCDKQDKNENKIVNIEPPLDLLKLEPECVARSDEMELPRFYEFTSVKNLNKGPMIEIKRSNLTLWEPFKSEMKTMIGNWDLDDLNNVKEIDMEDLINKLKTIKHVHSNTNTWNTPEGWAGFSGITLVLSISIILVCFKHDKCLAARAWSHWKEKQTKPAEGTEVIPLKGASDEPPKLVVEAEPTQENSGPRYDLYPKI